MDYLSSLPVEIFIQNITYLPFSEVITVCTVNKKLHNYCTDDKYKLYWKQLVDTTFGKVYGYEDKVKKVWKKLNLPENTYNYVVYTNMVRVLDPITQLLIYHRQNDEDSFNDHRFSDQNRFLALFLLRERGLITKYLPLSADGDDGNFNTEVKGFPYYMFIYEMDKKELTQIQLNRLMGVMAIHNNVAGVKYFINKGAQPDSGFGFAMVLSAQKGNTDVVKYLLEQGVDPDSDDGYALELASNNGHLDTVKVLVEKGADPHINDDKALEAAIRNGHDNVVQYLSNL